MFRIHKTTYHKMNKSKFQKFYKHVQTYYVGILVVFFKNRMGYLSGVYRLIVFVFKYYLHCHSMLFPQYGID